MTIRAIIVDDEPLARQRLSELLAEQPDVEVVAECPTGEAAIEAIGKLRPDLLFLDIQMPEVDGFGVMLAIGPGTVPVVIFVTAYDQFAVRAFEAHALDYLLKPFDDERFEAALERARHTIRQHREGDLDRRMRALLQEVRPSREYLQRLSVRAGMRTVLVRAAEIDWLEAEGKYVRLHVGGRTHLIRDTLARLEGALDPSLFRRIHRSTIVNLERVREIETLFQGDCVLILQDGTRLNAGRAYRKNLDELVGRGS
jgi:two-component system, LytTR family, response regulator